MKERKLREKQTHKKERSETKTERERISDRREMETLGHFARWMDRE